MQILTVKRFEMELLDMERKILRYQRPQKLKFLYCGSVKR